MKNNMMVLQFIINDMYLCADIQYIEKVILLPLIEPIPSAPYYIAGQMNVAGKSLPVIDLTLYLGLKRLKPYTVDTPILLCNDKNYQAGFIVDKLLSLDEINSVNIQMKERFKQNSAFKASALLEDKLTLLLNVENILLETASFDSHLIVENQHD